MFGRDLRTRFSLIKPGIKEKVKRKSKLVNKIKLSMLDGKKREFMVGDKVTVKDYRVVNKVSWIPGIIEKRIGKCTYYVKIPELNAFWKRHTNQILKTNVQSGLKDLDIISVDCNSEISPEGGDHLTGSGGGIQSSTSRPKRLIKPPDRLMD
jgi:hypothetical protein